MNFAATLARGLFSGPVGEGRLPFAPAHPANMGEDYGCTQGNNELQQEKELPVSEAEEMLVIGEAVPEGEHLRTLRVYSRCSSQATVAATSGARSSEAGSTDAGVPANEGEAESEGSSRGCRDVHVLRVFRDPDVMIAPNLITKEQCAHLLKLADGKWTRSKTSVGTTSAPQTAYRTTESRTRTSYSVMLEEAQTPGVVSVELLACALAQMPVQHLESLVLVRYAEGEYFAEHHDGGFRPKTVLLYLNDVEEGGYTHFTRLGLKIGPSQGSAVLWSNVTPTGQVDFRTMHAGVSPTKGTKYVVNCFFNEAIVRHEKPPALLPLEPPQGIPDFQQQRTGAGSPPPAETGKNTAMRDSVNANGRFPPHTEHSQPQQLQQQQLETSKIWGSQHRPVWGLPGTEARGKQTFCPAVLFSLPQQQLQQHAMPHGTVYPTPGWMVGGAKLPGAPVGLPFTATGSPPAGWRSHAAGSLPLDQRWM